MRNEMREYCEAGVNKALSTDPCDRDAAEQTIHQMYLEQGLRDPDIVWFNSFQECALADEFYSPTVAFEKPEDFDFSIQKSCQNFPVSFDELQEMYDWISSRNSRIVNLLLQKEHALVNDKINYPQAVLHHAGAGTTRCEYVWSYIFKFLKDEFGVQYEGEFAKSIADWKVLGDSAHIMAARREFVLMVERPVTFKVNDIYMPPEGIRLTSEEGPAIELRDGTKYWEIDGVEVNEKIVMSPETQTIPEIDAEINEEVKRIRIERFGWNRFLAETNAEVIELRRNDIEVTKENLLTRDDISVLMCHCPSTGRIYNLPVPATIRSCEEAVDWLWNSNQSRYGKARIIGRS